MLFTLIHRQTNQRLWLNYMASPQTIQPDSPDTYLSSYNPTNNYSAAANLYVSAYSIAKARAILKFDFSAVVPDNATITLATLTLFSTYSSVAGRTITCYRLLRTDWVYNQATWNIYKTGSNWGTAGALNSSTDYTTTDSATAKSIRANYLSWNVTAQVQTARTSVGGVAHFLLADVGADSTDATYYAKYNDTGGGGGLKPKLYIEYTVASGPTNLKSYNTNLKANIKTINTNPIANVKSLNTNI